MPLEATADKSILVQAMAWCRQATSHYLSQCWPRSMSPNGVTMPQWVNSTLPQPGGHPLSKLMLTQCFHDDVIKWEYFPCYWPFVQGIHRSLVNSSHKAQQLQALMFSIIFAWIYGWVNNHEAGDLRCHHAHYDVTVMSLMHICIPGSSTVIKRDYSWRNVQLMCISPISDKVYE